MNNFIRYFVIITWAIVSSIIALLILGSTMYFKLANPTAPLPEVLQNWGGIILGFYFGSFTSYAKDVLTMKDNRKNHGELDIDQDEERLKLSSVR
jgi:H+/Cl- antiporter ClcA